jgi:CBS domain-containing membrane protein
MATIRKALHELTAADLMSRDLFLIPQQLTLREAAGLLSQAKIGSVPIVDPQRRCIGMLTATDFLRWALSHETQAPNQKTAGDDWIWHVGDPKTPIEKVAAFMSPKPVMVPPTMPIRELAKRMADSHVHRLVVVDDDGTPIGIVSSIDVLRAFASAQMPVGQKNQRAVRKLPEEETLPLGSHRRDLG